MFLRVYECRNKFWFLINKQPQGKIKIICNLSSCAIQKYNGYVVVKVEKKNQEKQMFEPTDIVYDPAQDFDDIIDCYFTFHYQLKFSTRFDATCAISFIPLKRLLENIFCAVPNYLEFYTYLTTQT